MNAPELMLMVPVDPPQEEEYSIDELAAHTRVASRTIRFYQSKGALPKPEIRGRKAVYGRHHVERLALIGTLQDRGLQIKAIRDLTQRIDRGELTIDEWLGLEDTIGASWSDETPKLYTKAELLETVGRSGAIGGLIASGLLERKGDAYLAPSPSLLSTVIQMESAGIDLEVAVTSAELARKHLGRLAVDLVRHYGKYAGEGFGRSHAPADLAEAYAGVRPHTKAVVRSLFASEMERVLREFLESGRAAKGKKS